MKNMLRFLLVTAILSIVTQRAAGCCNGTCWKDPGHYELHTCG